MADFVVSQGLDHFRGDETLCDVTLVPGDSSETFPVHRVIMASASDYFKAMFTGTHQIQEEDFLFSKLITVVVLVFICCLIYLLFISLYDSG